MRWVQSIEPKKPSPNKHIDKTTLLQATVEPKWANGLLLTANKLSPCVKIVETSQQFQLYKSEAKISRKQELVANCCWLLLNLPVVDFHSTKRDGLVSFLCLSNALRLYLRVDKDGGHGTSPKMKPNISMTH